MLLAASESAVTKKPRLRLTMRRSSSERPFGSFHRAMSRFMLISCGIQWLAQVARYFSQAHLYLKGTSWLTSVAPLMMRFSATLTRRAETSLCGATGTGSVARRGDAGTTFASRRGIGLWIVVDRRSSSQTSMSALPMTRNYRSVVSEHQALLDISALALLHASIAARAPVRRPHRATTNAPVRR